MIDQPLVSELARDMRFEGFLLVRSSEQRVANSGSRYIDMNLCDKTGEINAKIWDSAYTPPKQGTVIKLRANILEYNGRLQMRVDKMRDANEDDAIDVRQLTPCAPETPEAMMDYINQTILEMGNEDIQKILRELLSMAGGKLLYFPAAQRLHHAERSGLLHHTTNMIKSALAIWPCYPWLNKDLLLAGVIIHDLSKITEMDSDELGNVKDYTKDGLLLGHLVRGVSNVEKAAQTAGVSGEIVLLLEHMVISHHGEAEFGSPRKPMFPEAEVLHWLDLLDARMNEMEGILDRTPEGAFSEKIWSLDRRVYHPVYSELAYQDKE